MMAAMIPEHIMAKEMALYEGGVDVARLWAEHAPVEFPDFTLHTAEGPRLLSSFAGPHGRLLVIHNMGASCSYCTMWADVLSGCFGLLREEMAVLLVSPDAPDAEAARRELRGWPFEMASDLEGAFTNAAGFMTAEGTMPGASAYLAEAGQLRRAGGTFFGPHDRYNPVWPLLALFPGGADSYEPA